MYFVMLDLVGFLHGESLLCNEQLPLKAWTKFPRAKHINTSSSSFSFASFSTRVFLYSLSNSTFFSFSSWPLLWQHNSGIKLPKKKNEEKIYFFVRSILLFMSWLLYLLFSVRPFCIWMFQDFISIQKV